MSALCTICGGMVDSKILENRRSNFCGGKNKRNAKSIECNSSDNRS